MCICSGRCESISLTSTEPWRFVISRWQNPVRRSFAYICYRLTLAAFFLVWTVIDGCTFGGGDQKSMWLVHITNWSKVLVVIDTIIQAVNTSYYQLIKLKKSNNDVVQMDIRFSNALVFLYGFQWLVTNVSGVFALTTSNAAFIERDTSGGFHAARYFCNVLYVVVDHSVNAQPKRLGHMVYALVLHAFYIVVNVVFAMAGGRTPDGQTSVDGVDWHKPALASGYVTISLLLVVASHLLLWSLVQLRDLVYRCCSERESTRLRIMRENPEYGTKSTSDQPQTSEPQSSSTVQTEEGLPVHQTVPRESQND